MSVCYAEISRPARQTEPAEPVNSGLPADCSQHPRTMVIQPSDTILFTGDSITDAGRVREGAKHLGFGCAAFTAARR